MKVLAWDIVGGHPWVPFQPPLVSWDYYGSFIYKDISGRVTCCILSDIICRGVDDGHSAKFFEESIHEMKGIALHRPDMHAEQLHGTTFSTWYRRVRLFRKLKKIKREDVATEEPAYDIERIRKTEYPLLEG